MLILSRFTGAARELRDALSSTPTTSTRWRRPSGRPRDAAGERGAAWRGCASGPGAQHLPLGRLAPRRAGAPPGPGGSLRLNRRPGPGPGVRTASRRRATPPDRRPCPAAASTECGMASRLRRDRARGRAPRNTGRRAGAGSAGVRTHHPRVDVVGIAHLLVDVRAWEAVTRYLSEFTSRGQAGLALATLKLAILVEAAVAVLGFGLVWLASAWVATRLFGDPSLEPLILLGAMTLVAGAFDRTARAVLRVFDRFRTLGLCSAIEALLSLLFVIAAVTAGAQAKGVLVAHLAAALAGALVLPAVAGRRFTEALARTRNRSIRGGAPLLARDGRIRWPQCRSSDAEGGDAAARPHPPWALPAAGRGGDVRRGPPAGAGPGGRQRPALLRRSPSSRGPGWRRGTSSFGCCARWRPASLS